MKQHILEQFIDRVINILVESRLDERILANKIEKDETIRRGANAALGGLNSMKVAREHNRTSLTKRPEAAGHSALSQAGAARRKGGLGSKFHSKRWTQLSKDDRTYPDSNLPTKKPLP